jgi:hypothetical protein
LNGGEQHREHRSGHYPGPERCAERLMVVAVPVLQEDEEPENHDLQNRSDNQA